MQMRKMILVFISFLILYSNCSNNRNGDERINISILNSSDESVYIGDIHFRAVACWEEEKIYYLSPPTFFDQSSIRTVGPFNFDKEVKANSEINFQIKNYFPIDDERYTLLIDERGLEKKVISEPSYSTVVFQFYYTKSEYFIDNYNEYLRVVENEGHLARGNKTNNELFFKIGDAEESQR